MALHLIKLVVGVETLDELIAWRRARERHEPEWFVQTRMTPKRAHEVEDGGSIYRVIKGVIVARQRVLRIESHGEGQAKRCRIFVSSEVVRTAPLSHRPFQGWRYLQPKDAPADISGAGEHAAAMPADLVAQLRDLGAW